MLPKPWKCGTFFTTGIQLKTNSPLKQLHISDKHIIPHDVPSVLLWMIHSDPKNFFKKLKKKTVGKKTYLTEGTSFSLYLLKPHRSTSHDKVYLSYKLLSCEHYSYTALNENSMTYRNLLPVTIVTKYPVALSLSLSLSLSLALSVCVSLYLSLPFANHSITRRTLLKHPLIAPKKVSPCDPGLTYVTFDLAFLINEAVGVEPSVTYFGKDRFHKAWHAMCALLGGCGFSCTDKAKQLFLSDSLLYWYEKTTAKSCSLFHINYSLLWFTIFRLLYSFRSVSFRLRKWVTAIMRNFPFAPQAPLLWCFELRLSDFPKKKKNKLNTWLILVQLLHKIIIFYHR